MFIIISHTDEEYTWTDEIVEYTMDSVINTDFIESISQCGQTFKLKMVGGGEYTLKPDQVAKVVSSLGLEGKVRLSRVTEVRRWDSELCQYVPLPREQVIAQYGDDVSSEL